MNRIYSSRELMQEMIAKCKKLLTMAKWTETKKMSGVTLYDFSNIDYLPWEECREGEKIRDFFLPLIKEGSDQFIANVKTSLFLLKINTHLIPITLNEAEYHNSYVASNFYVIPRFDEWLKSRFPSWRWPLMPLIWMGSVLLKVMKVNKVIFLNNWLLTHNLFLELTRQEVEEIVSYLKQTFPDYLLVMRNIDTYLGSNPSDAFKKEGAHLVKTRIIYFYDPHLSSKLSSKVHYHHRRDLKLIEKEGYELIREESIAPDEYGRLIALYNKIYLKKHTDYSPRYSEKFLRHLVDKKLLHLIALKKNGVIDGIIGYFFLNGRISSPFFGYETEVPQTGTLYRMLTVLLIKEAERLETLLNDGSGGESTKKYRGLKPFLEYTAILSSHLPLPRRFFWSFSVWIYNKIVFPSLEKKIGKL